MNGIHSSGHSPANSPEYLRLLAQHNTLNQEVSRLRHNVNFHGNEVIAFRSQIDMLTSESDTLRAENISLCNQLKDEMLMVKEHWFTLKQQITVLEDQAGTLKNQFSTDIPMLKDQITMLKNQNDTLNYDLSTLKDDVSHAEVCENALKARIEAQNSRIKELEVRQDEQGIVLQFAMQMLWSHQDVAK